MGRGAVSVNGIGPRVLWKVTQWDCAWGGGGFRRAVTTGVYMELYTKFCPDLQEGSERERG